jgi:hypothetical protein
MIADVLSLSGGPIWLAVAITIAAIVAYAGIVIRVVRMNKADIEAMGRLALDDTPSGDNTEGARHGKI